MLIKPTTHQEISFVFIKYKYIRYKETGMCSTTHNFDYCVLDPVLTGIVGLPATSPLKSKIHLQ
jgi:hypothetical protein